MLWSVKARGAIRQDLAFTRNGMRYRLDPKGEKECFSPSAHRRDKKGCRGDRPCWECRGQSPLWWRVGRRKSRSSIGQEYWFLTFAAAALSKKIGTCKMALCFPECVRCGTCGSCAACSAMRKHEGNDNAVSSCFHPFFPCVRDGSPERQRQHCWLCSRQPGTRGERPICQNLTL